MPRFLILVQLDMKGSELADRMLRYKKLLEDFSTTKPAELFIVGNNIAHLYTSDEPASRLARMLTNPANGLPLLRGADTHLILELGSDFDATGQSRSWGWLQRN